MIDPAWSLIHPFIPVLLALWHCLDWLRVPIRTISAQYPGDKIHNLYSSGGVPDLFSGTPTTSQCIIADPEAVGCTMGYSVITRVGGCEYRYTEWADFNTPGHRLKVNWGRIVGVELYVQHLSSATRKNELTCVTLFLN